MANFVAGFTDKDVEQRVGGAVDEMPAQQRLVACVRTEWMHAQEVA